MTPGEQRTRAWMTQPQIDRMVARIIADVEAQRSNDAAMDAILGRTIQRAQTAEKDARREMERSRP